MIKKWQIRPMEPLALAHDMQVLCVGLQGGDYYAWTVAPTVSQPGRVLTLYPTGADTPKGVYRGSIIDHGRHLVWHAFERVEVLDD